MIRDKEPIKIIALEELFSSYRVGKMRVSCIYSDEKSGQRSGVITYEVSNGRKYYYLGDKVILDVVMPHEYDSIGEMVMELKGKIEEMCQPLKFEFLKYKTGERFEITIEAMNEEMRGGRIGKNSYFTEDIEVDEPTLEEILATIKWMEGVRDSVICLICSKSEGITDEKRAEHRARYNLADTAIKALKKQVPEKPVIKPWSPALCRDCGEELSDSAGDGCYSHYTSLKVCECGKKLDWSGHA